MAENPQASLLFFWDKLERQIRINGSVEKITSEESDGYFQTRDHVSKLGAWASKQSAPLSSRFSLIRAVAKLMLRYPTHVPLPPHWGGYRLVPKEFEFWQGRKSRLHDRFRYDLSEGEWSINRLYP
jgi:pyridoxamine 5'-phosphate oxidase